MIPAPKAIKPTEAAVSCGPIAAAIAINPASPATISPNATTAPGPADPNCAAAIAIKDIPADARRIAAPNAKSPGAAFVSFFPNVSAITIIAIIPPSIAASPTSAIGPAAANCVAAYAIKDIPAEIIRTAPPNAISPFFAAVNSGPILDAITIRAPTPAAIATSPICAAGPAEEIRIAASANSHIPAAASARPAPTAAIFFAAADISLLACVNCGAAFPAPFILLRNPDIFFEMLPIPPKAAKPAATAGISAINFSNGAMLSSPRKSTYSPNASFAAFIRYAIASLAADPSSGKF